MKSNLNASLASRGCYGRHTWKKSWWRPGQKTEKSFQSQVTVSLAKTWRMSRKWSDEEKKDCSRHLWGFPVKIQKSETGEEKDVGYGYRKKVRWKEWLKRSKVAEIQSLKASKSPKEVWAQCKETPLGHAWARLYLRAGAACHVSPGVSLVSV